MSLAEVGRRLIDVCKGHAVKPEVLTWLKDAGIVFKETPADIVAAMLSARVPLSIKDDKVGTIACVGCPAASCV